VILRALATPAPVDDGRRMTSMTTVLCFTLLVLACGWLTWTDIRFGIIPDWLNAGIAALGLARGLATDGASAAVMAAAAGVAIGASLLLLRTLYASWRGVQGLGLGDVKFLAAAGIWTGLSDFPVLLLVATLAALLLAGVLYLRGRAVTARTSLPFGPSLAFGLLVTLVLQPLTS
jgi:leader peptidase (prepilin peptidase) / N-methyltransferase